MMSTLSEEQQQEQEIEAARHQHAEFFDMPADALTYAERRARNERPYNDE